MVGPAVSNIKSARLALDTYVLAQDVKTGVHRVCDELFGRLLLLGSFDVRLLVRDGDEQRTQEYFAARGLRAPICEAAAPPSVNADILLSPFGVAPATWLADKGILHAHIVYDLIGINRPDLFTEEAAAEVRDIIDSLDEHTVVFAISQSTKNDLLAARPDLSPRQVVVIPLAAGSAFAPCEDIDERGSVRARYGIPQGVPYVLSVATLEIRKNLHKVVEAFAGYLDLHADSNLHLVLSGMAGWKQEQLEQALASAQRWRSRIVLTGFVEDADLSALYSEALCFVYLSLYEGFGLPPLEAMACGAPVICADNSSLPEVVGQAGILVDANDVDGTIAAIGRIAAFPAYAQELSQAGLARARLFSWERCAQIVSDTLHGAYVRFAERPARRRGRDLMPGSRLRRAMRDDGIVEAGLLDYQNGSQGPCFLSALANERPKAVGLGSWPHWVDRLAVDVEETRAAEGGLRTRGIYKYGAGDLPLVTYITVVRNGESTLARAIESVQQQAYQNVEHIIVDGASVDDTLGVIRRHADRVDYFVSESDKGLYDALNKAICLAHGDLICVLNADDWLQPDAAEIAVHRMGDCSAAAILLTGANVRGDEVELEWYPSFVHPGTYFECANVCHNGVYATRAAYEHSGPYDASFRIAADFKWIMACLDRGVRFRYTREVTINYTLGGVSSNARQHAIECMRVVGERFPGLSPNDVSGLYHCFFVFGAAASWADRPDHHADFLRDLLGRQSGDADFVQALTWASMAKLEHPADSVQPVAQNIGSPSVNQRLKELLRNRPVAYRIARRLYQTVRGA